jgi:hypothetical protein
MSPTDIAEIISWALLAAAAWYGLIKALIIIDKEKEKRKKESADYRF